MTSPSLHPEIPADIRSTPRLSLPIHVSAASVEIIQGGSPEFSLTSEGSWTTISVQDDGRTMKMFLPGMNDAQSPANRKSSNTWAGSTELGGITRLEVIGVDGRSYVKYLEAPGVEAALSEDGQTLQVFFGTTPGAAI